MPVWAWALLAWVLASGVLLLLWHRLSARGHAASERSRAEANGAAAPPAAAGGPAPEPDRPPVAPRAGAGGPGPI